MGDSAGDSNETERQVTVAPFRMLAREVTNREFTEFVRATGHVADPERSGEGYVWTDRWRAVTGADWRRPNGPASSIADRVDHPVVQVSWRDAADYCAWRGQRLPTEPEWEFAARGGDGRRYAWAVPHPPSPAHFRHAGRITAPTAAARRMTPMDFVKPLPSDRFPPGFPHMVCTTWPAMSGNGQRPDFPDSLAGT